VFPWAKLPNEIKHEILKALLYDGVSLAQTGWSMFTWHLERDSLFRQVYRFAWTSRTSAEQISAVCHNMAGICPRPCHMPQQSWESADEQYEKHIHWHRLRAALFYIRMLQHKPDRPELCDILRGGLLPSVTTTNEHEQGQPFAKVTFPTRLGLRLGFITTGMSSNDMSWSLVSLGCNVWLPVGEIPVLKDSACDISLFEFDQFQYRVGDGTNLGADILRSYWRQSRGQTQIIEVQ
jgi:hypothetical protein